MTTRALMTTRRGMSLVELIVALAVLGIGVLGLVGAASVAQRAFTGADAAERAARTAAQVIDSLMLVPLPVAGERIIDGVRAAWTVQAHDALRPAMTRIVIDVEINDAGARRTVTWQAVHNARLLR